MFIFILLLISLKTRSNILVKLYSLIRTTNSNDFPMFALDFGNSVGHGHSHMPTQNGKPQILLAIAFQQKEIYTINFLRLLNAPSLDIEASSGFYEPADIINRPKDSSRKQISKILIYTHVSTREFLLLK